MSQYPISSKDSGKWGTNAIVWVYATNNWKNWSFKDSCLLSERNMHHKSSRTLVSWYIDWIKRTPALMSQGGISRKGFLMWIALIQKNKPRLDWLSGQRTGSRLRVPSARKSLRNSVLMYPRLTRYLISYSSKARSNFRRTTLYQAWKSWKGLSTANGTMPHLTVPTTARCSNNKSKPQ